MNEEGFRKFLKRGGRSLSAIKRAVSQVAEFEQYLRKHRDNRGLDDAGYEDLEAFVLWVEKEQKAFAKLHLWGIRYYYEYISNKDMSKLAGELRKQRIEQKPFALKEFRGVDPEYLRRLESVGIQNVKEMLDSGRTLLERKRLSAKTGIPLDVILEFVKLSDLARIRGVKSIRARLYYDAGVDSVEKLANRNPKELRAMLIEFVEKTGFDGVAPLLKEAEFTVAEAKRLPEIVEY